mmetsp:Transcript_24185/g.45471  ORF Transcript_24185/g.45471 Transcript_24185/m.45471 type:complete len:523 (+) Transcript_24185:2029-3597(+)
MNYARPEVVDANAEDAPLPFLAPTLPQGEGVSDHGEVRAPDATAHEFPQPPPDPDAFLPGPQAPHAGLQPQSRPELLQDDGLSLFFLLLELAHLGLLLPRAERHPRHAPEDPPHEAPKPFPIVHVGYPRVVRAADALVQEPLPEAFHDYTVLLALPQFPRPGKEALGQTLALPPFDELRHHHPAANFLLGVELPRVVALGEALVRPSAQEPVHLNPVLHLSLGVILPRLQDVVEAFVLPHLDHALGRRHAHLFAPLVQQFQLCFHLLQPSSLLLDDFLALRQQGLNLLPSPAPAVVAPNGPRLPERQPVLARDEPVHESPDPLPLIHHVDPGDYGRPGLPQFHPGRELRQHRLAPLLKRHPGHPRAERHVQLPVQNPAQDIDGLYFAGSHFLLVLRSLPPLEGGPKLPVNHPPEHPLGELARPSPTVDEIAPGHEALGHLMVQEPRSEALHYPSLLLQIAHESHPGEQAPVQAPPHHPLQKLVDNGPVPLSLLKVFLPRQENLVSRSLRPPLQELCHPDLSV